MIAVITGDIVNSRALSPDWILQLKKALGSLSKKTIRWEIFRGDSFQIESPVADVLWNALYLKTCIKTIKGADVRMSIGIGKKAKSITDKVTEANGEAYINSGEAFDTLKSAKINLMVKSPSEKFDDDMNLYFKLASIVMDNWSVTSAKVLKHMIENHNEKQDKIAKISGRSQSSISESLKRAHFTEIMEMEKKFREKVASTFK